MSAGCNKRFVGPSPGVSQSMVAFTVAISSSTSTSCSMFDSKRGPLASYSSQSPCSISLNVSIFLGGQGVCRYRGMSICAVTIMGQAYEFKEWVDQRPTKNATALQAPEASVPRLTCVPTARLR